MDRQYLVAEGHESVGLVIKREIWEGIWNLDGCQTILRRHFGTGILSDSGCRLVVYRKR